MSGQARDAQLPALLQWHIAHYPEEPPLDAGPAKCRKLDSALYDEYAQIAGGRPRGGQVMEASWLATDASLMYVNPGLNFYRRWGWPEVDLWPIKRGRHFGKVGLSAAGDTWKLGVGGLAMDNLLAIYSWSRGSGQAGPRSSEHAHRGDAGVGHQQRAHDPHDKAASLQERLAQAEALLRTAAPQDVEELTRLRDHLRAQL